MSIDLGHGKNVHSVSLIDAESGNEILSFHRERSRCSFFKEIELEKFYIAFRIDWGDIRDTDPVLDADIFVRTIDGKGKKIRNGQWHHTLKEENPDGRTKTYNFSFDELKLCLIAKMNFSLSVTAGAIIVKHEDSA